MKGSRFPGIGEIQDRVRKQSRQFPEALQKFSKVCCVWWRLLQSPIKPFPMFILYWCFYCIIYRTSKTHHVCGVVEVTKPEMGWLITSITYTVCEKLHKHSLIQNKTNWHVLHKQLVHRFSIVKQCSVKEIGKYEKSAVANREHGGKRTPLWEQD